MDINKFYMVLVFRKLEDPVHMLPPGIVQGVYRLLKAEIQNVIHVKD
jgi:hypothetical protein